MAKNKTDAKDEYFYLKLGVPRGPYTWQQFVDLAKEGTIIAGTSCIRNEEPSKAASAFFGKLWVQIEDFRNRVKHQEEMAKAELKEKKNAKRQEVEKERLLKQAHDEKVAEARKNAIQKGKERASENKQSKSSQFGVDVPMKFDKEIKLWIFVLDWIFSIAMYIGTFALVLLTAVFWFQTSPSESLSFCGLGLLYLLALFVAYRFQMIFFRFLQAVVRSLIEIRDQ